MLEWGEPPQGTRAGLFGVGQFGPAKSKMTLFQDPVILVRPKLLYSVLDSNEYHGYQEG